MLVWPMSSPKMTRMFGRWPAGRGAGCACACATCIGAPGAESVMRPRAWCCQAGPYGGQARCSRLSPCTDRRCCSCHTPVQCQMETFLVPASIAVDRLLRQFLPAPAVRSSPSRRSTLKLAGLLPRRELLEALQPFRDQRPGPARAGTCAAAIQFAVVEAVRSALERIGAQVVEFGRTQLGELPHPDATGSFGLISVFCSMNATFQCPSADRHQVAVVAPIEELLARRFLRLALEERHQVVAVEVDLEVLAVERVTLQQLLDQVGLARQPPRRSG